MGNLLNSFPSLSLSLTSVLRLAKTYCKNSQYDNVLLLLKQCNEFFILIPKAKTAKIVRNIIDLISTFPNSLSIQINLCREVIDWCKLEKRTFLRQRIESKVCHESNLIS
jgi:26S proteasome regulatory subunit N6